MGVLLSVYGRYVTRWRTDKCVKQGLGGAAARTPLCVNVNKNRIFMMYCTRTVCGCAAYVLCIMMNVNVNFLSLWLFLSSPSACVSVEAWPFCFVFVFTAVLLTCCVY